MLPQPQPILSSTILSITIFFLLPIPPSYSDTFDAFIECYRSPSFRCGRLGTVHYPFWNDSAPDHCRPLGFHLTNCEDKFPIIDIGPDGSFFLMDINPSNYTLTIASTDYTTYICPETPQNKTLLHPFLKFSKINKNLTLFYNCTPPAEVEVPPENRINITDQCKSMHPFYMNDSVLDRDEYRELYSCGTAVNFEVNLTVFNSFQDKRMVLVDALRSGFEVEYNISAVLCNQCDRLGGKCEFSSSSAQNRTCQQTRRGMDYIICKTI